MKKLLTFFLMALLAFGVGWAAEVTFVGGTDVGSTTNQSSDSMTKDGITISSTSAGLAYSEYRFYNGTITISSTVGNMTSVVFTCTSSSYANVLSGSTPSEGSFSQSGTTVTWTGDASSFTIRNTAQFRASQIVVTTASGSVVTPPTISPNGGNFATSQQVTLSHADADAIYYTLDGSDPKTSSTPYTAPFTITTTTTVKAIAVKDGVSSSPATATFTNIGVGTIADAYALAQGSEFIFTGNAVVTYQNGRYVWIRDNSGSGLIYRNSGETSTLNNGDILEANWSATNTTWNSIPEFTNPTGVASSSNGGTVAPFDKTSMGITSANMNEYVSFSNVTLEWDTSVGYCYYTAGNNRVYFRNDFLNYNSTGLTVTSGHTYNIEGIAYMQNGNAFVYMTAVTEIVTQNPLLEISPASQSINDAAPASLTITGTNVDGNINASLATNTDWYLNPNTFSNTGGTATLTYTGRDLSATNTVTASASGATNVSATVDYRADLYIVTDNGVTGDWHFDGTYGTPMTYNNGVYTASFTANTANTFILFARKTGNDVTWNTRYVFGPQSDGDWWLPISGNGNGTIDTNDDDPIKIQTTGTYIITIDANAGTFTITKEAVSAGDFALVTDASQLVAGNEVIIVNSGTAGDAVAMSTVQNSSNRGQTDVTVSQSLKVTATDATQIFKLEGGSTGWYFKTVNGNTQGYIYAASSSNNQLKTEAVADDNAKALISIESGDVASIVFQGTNTRNILRYNSDSRIFACYNNTNQRAVYIYQRTASTEPSITVNPSSLDLVIPAGGSSQSGEVTVTEDNTTGTTSVTINGDTNIFSASLNNGTLTVTYNGTATQDNPDQATVTLTNGTATATVSVTGYKEPLTVTITPGDGHTFQGSTVTGLIESNVDGATIEYSFDGTTWQTYDANEGFTATVSSVGGTVTVYARATYNGETATTQATYTRIAQSTTCTADIVFAPQSNNGEMSQWSTFLTHIGQGANYMSSGTVSKLWTNTAYNAMRFGSGNYTGELVLNLDLKRFETGACKLTKVIINAARYGSDGNNCELKVSNNVNTTGMTLPITNDQTAFADYAFSFDGSEITSLTIENTSTSNGRVYVHSISLEYSCGASVEAPVITPASGTYYEGQTVEITAETGATIYYTTDGSDPTTSSTQYSGTFNVPYVAGGSTTVKAIAVVEENGEQIISEVASVTYVWGTPSVSINPGTHSTTASSVAVTLTGTPAGATIYYTTDGSDPSAQNGTLYEGPFSVDLDEIGDEVTVKAIAVYNGQSGAVAQATYTRVDKMVDVAAPFFSPVQNNTYYGDQTLEIGCATPNADIYFVIVPASGATAPDAATVSNPNKSSTYYDGTPITMTAGNSYYVKAIAYIGNYASTVSEGWYIILPADDSSWQNPTGATTVLENVAQLHSTNAGSVVTFRNPVQVVFMSKFTNDDTPYTYSNPIPEYAYVRDNTGYGLIYFGKGAWEWAYANNSHTNSPATIFERGDWIAGNLISGKTGTWTNGLLPQVGTSEGTGKGSITSWPADTIRRTPIIAEEATCAEISSGTEQDNLCGHYLHLRYTTMSDVADYSSNDPRHNGVITDPSGSCTYYDRFWLYSGQGLSYTYDNKAYTIEGRGHYDQAWFNQYQNAGATFDVFCISDYYSGLDIPYEVFPIDFLWIYKPEISLASGTYTSTQTVTITADKPAWAAENVDVVIYYKTDDMEDWAVYTEPIIVDSDTHIQAYAEVSAEKTDGTNYDDYVRSETVEATYEFEGIEDPIITDHLDDPNEDSFADRVIEEGTVQNVPVTVMGNSASSPNTVTLYTTDGSDPRDSQNAIAYGEDVVLTITETTTIRTISYLVVDENTTLWSNEVTRTYTFVKKNSVIYNLLTAEPVEGNVYVIVNKDAYMGMSTTQNATNRGSVGVMFTDETKDRVYGNDELAQFVVEKATAGRYYFKNINGDNTGYLVVTSATGPSLNTGSQANSYAEADVDVENGNGYPATITFSYDGVTRYLRYFANGRTFSTYTSANINEEVYLYGLEATPLAYIESSIEPIEDVNNIQETDKQVIVSDELIGVWAVHNPATGVNILWAKDQGNVSIDKTFKTDEQTDYVKDIWGLETKDEWDQSNWVALDFSGTGESAFDYQSRKLKSMTVTGYYYDDKNYAIKLTAAPEKVDDNDVTGYPGYNGDYKETSTGVVYYNNHYTPTNFMPEYLNAPYGEGAEAGPASQHQGMKLFFMNPKVQEIAQVWAVWMGNDRFDVLTKGTDSQGNTVNGFDLSGSFNVLTWDYNRLGGSDEQPEYGSPLDGNADALEYGTPYLFHIIVTRNDYDYGHVRRAPGATPSGAFGIMPADLPAGHPNPTAVKDVNGIKQVESVRYYNIMGMESKTPFEGVNIVVTRFSDGSVSTFKVIK